LFSKRISYLLHREGDFLYILLEEPVPVAATMLKNSNIPIGDSSPAVGDVNKL